MARGNWDDFQSKYGFNEGAATEARDWRVRDILCGLLNARAEMKTAGVRAIAYDRAGMHNACLVLLLKAVEGKTDEQLLAEWQGSADAAIELPDLEVEIDQLVEEAYDADEVPPGSQKGKNHGNSSLQSRIQCAQ